MKRVTGILAVTLMLGAAPIAVHAQGAAAPVSAAPAANAAPAAGNAAATPAPVTESKTDESSGGGVSPSSIPTMAPPSINWSFNGIFGNYDRASLQRGFQIYSQVCSTCHSMNLLSYRNLTALGYTADEVKAIAAAHQVTDLGDDGQPKQRPGLPSDRFVSPYPNAKAAAAVFGGAVPPDMSLLAKAREGGPDYIYGILTGFEGAPPNVNIPTGRYWNKYMPGHVIAMPQPLQAGQVTYSDGTPETLDQYARDVSTFLAWASEPHMEERKRTGIKAFLFLLVFTGIMYGVKKKIWANAH